MTTNKTRRTIDDTVKQEATERVARASAVDSFVNFAQKMGVGADNPMTGGTYGFNPISRNRLMLEWIHVAHGSVVRQST